MGNKKLSILLRSAVFVLLSWPLAGLPVRLFVGDPLHYGATSITGRVCRGAEVLTCAFSKVLFFNLMVAIP